MSPDTYPNIDLERQQIGAEAGSAGDFRNVIITGLAANTAPEIIWGWVGIVIDFPDKMADLTEGTRESRHDMGVAIKYLERLANVDNDPSIAARINDLNWEINKPKYFALSLFVLLWVGGYIFVKKKPDWSKRINLGAPLERATKMGPLVSKEQYDRVSSYLEIGKKEAKVAIGGGRPKGFGKGYYVEPTIFYDVDNNARISREEIFGPVATVIPFDDEAGAIRSFS